MEDVQYCISAIALVRPLITIYCIESTPTLNYRTILTMFQIPDAASDVVTRTTALLSLTCALMSLCYGCVYIVRFGTMRSMFRASRWAEVSYS